jgi:hypothetical protein
MQIYYEQSTSMDRYLVKAVLGATWILFMWSAILCIVNLIFIINTNSKMKKKLL